jgi:hypothetical protein
MLHDKDLVSIQEVRTKVDRAYAAAREFRAFTQERVDAVVEAMAATGRAHARRLAERAVEETGYGNVPDKTTKNLLAADFLMRKLRGMKTVGVLRELADERVVAAICPVTNPTSTAVAAAVDRYLASRGMGPGRATRDIAAEVVDRYLAGRGVSANEPAAPAPACKPGGG